MKAPATATGKSATDAAANIALQRLARAVDEWSKSPSVTAPAGASPRVYIDVNAIARRLPAWRLADALERNPAAPAFAWNESFRPRVALESGSSLSSPVSSRSDSASSPDFDRTSAGGAMPARVDEETIVAERLEPLEEVAQRRQNNAYLLFLRDAAVQQREARFDRAETMRADLEYDVEAARRAPLDELDPVLLAEATQLRLSNLRLKLLTATPAEQARLRDEISALEEAWQARLHSQEAQRLAELARLRSERPARVRREGELAIRAALAQGQVADAALRNLLLDEHRERVAQDFPATALSVGLPPAVLEPSADSNRSVFAVGNIDPRSSRVSVRTFSRAPASVAGVKWNEAVSEWQGAPVASGTRAQQLRNKAQTEARALAASIAKRHGWALASRKQGDSVMRDETATALREIPAI